MKKNIIIASLSIIFILFSCKNRYYKEIPYTLLYDQKEIESQLNIKSMPIIDTLNQEYENNLTDREIYLKEKYSIALGVLPEEIKNYKFYDFIDQYLGAKHSQKGFSKDSLSMGPFVSALYQYAFKKKLPAAPLNLFRSGEVDLFTGRKYLKEGDLIFFRYNKDNPVGDVAVYLRNSRILTSTKKNGLIISDFNHEYFQLRYVSAGRVRLSEENVTKNER